MIWGLKTVAIFDFWTFEHLLSGISIGTIAIRCNRKIFKKQFHIDKDDIKINFFHIILVLFTAYLWETVEHYLEIGIAGYTVEYWFQGVEYWANRIIADPLAMIVGYYIAKTQPNLVNPARFMSILWLFFHIFVFPHSMYLHELLWK